MLPIQWAVAQTTTVTYLPPEGQDDERSAYYIDVLELVLEKTVSEYGPYEMRPAEGIYTQREGLLAMRDGKIDVVHTMTSRRRELVFRPVRIPLTRGLIGYRLLLIKEGNEDIVTRNMSTTRIKNLRYAQGTDWPDTEILQKNGFDVMTRDRYEDLFTLIATDSADVFPRSMLEVWDELDTRVGFELENDLLIQYPAAIYFFTKMDNKKLAERLERGLKLAIDDGSFNELFDKYYLKYINQADILGRRMIKLENPLLPEETPLDNQKYWLNTDELERF